MAQVLTEQNTVLYSLTQFQFHFTVFKCVGVYGSTRNTSYIYSLSMFMFIRNLRSLRVSLLQTQHYSPTLCECRVEQTVCSTVSARGKCYSHLICIWWWTLASLFVKQVKYNGFSVIFPNWLLLTYKVALALAKLHLKQWESVQRRNTSPLRPKLLSCLLAS